MPMWKLIPLPADCDDWELSTYRGEVIVRAKDEREARSLVTRQFAAAAPRKLGKSTKLDPWENSDLVSCKEIPARNYSYTGPAAILEP